MAMQQRQFMQPYPSYGFMPQDYQDYQDCQDYQDYQDF